ncbi:MAG: flavodoxin family protein [Methanomassiliicoccaceae archaeon]|nr:flavodoxin family protein [Methanomassiliicoccaceae archaeon]
MKKMLMINGSPRSNGSSSEILDIIEDKVSSKGYECERIDLGMLKIMHCKGCRSCKSTGKCVTKDDMTPLYEKVQNADAITISVPVYFAAETGLLKNFIDRLYALMDRNEKGWNVRFGKVKKGVAAINCGAPDGNMIYHGMMNHLVTILRTFGSTDVASGIIPNASPDTIHDSQFTKDLLSGIDFLMSS